MAIQKATAAETATRESQGMQGALAAVRLQQNQWFSLELPVYT